MQAFNFLLRISRFMRFKDSGIQRAKNAALKSLKKVQGVNEKKFGNQLLQITMEKRNELNLMRSDDKQSVLASPQVSMEKHVDLLRQRQQMGGNNNSKIDEMYRGLNEFWKAIGGEGFSALMSYDT